MFVKHYNLTGRPFQLTPDARFYFESATHRKAMSYLGYGLAQGEGFIVITGDIGAGKTTLVGHLMATIDPQRLAAVKIAASEMDGDTALRLAAHAFGIETDGVEKAHVLSRLEAFMHHQARAGRRSLLIIDEAQTLGFDALEAMRMLSNFQLGGQSLVQIFLLGQPEFREAIEGAAELEQLRQRIIATHHLEPLQPGEVRPYLEHRLKVVGWTGNPRFEADAIALLAEASRGVPRLLNTLAQTAMERAAERDRSVIDLALVEAICKAREDALAPAPAAREQAGEGRTSLPAGRETPVAAAPAARTATAEPVATPKAVETKAAPPESAIERLERMEARLARLEAKAQEHDELLAGILARLIALVEEDEDDDGADVAPCAA